MDFNLFVTLMNVFKSMLSDFCNLLFPKPEGEKWGKKEIAFVMIGLVAVLTFLLLLSIQQ